MKPSLIGAAATLGSMAILTAAMFPFRHHLSRPLYLILSSFHD